MSRQLLSGRGSEGASRSHGVSAAAWATWGGYGVPFPTVVVAGTTTVFFYRLNIPTLRREHRARRSLPILFIASLLINVGMWFERFVIVVISLHRDFLPSSWDYYVPTFWDLATLAGSFGLFFTMFTLFVRYLPMVAMSEVKAVLPQAHVHDRP